jgi:D-3-phosphoglycerate dehydrogenase
MTVGIIGYGHIGRVTARKLAQGFGARVLVHSPSLLENHVLGDEIAPGVLVASLEHIQHGADAIVLHLPLTSENRHMVDAAFIAACRRRPMLINVSRGGLVDNDALVQALDAGLLSGAALDVVEGEPAPPIGVIGRPDVIVTPHVAFSSDASLEELRRRCTEDVVRVLRGETPLHPCNSPRRTGAQVP